MLKFLRLGRLAKVFRLTKVTKLGKLFNDSKAYVEDHYRVHIPEASLMLGRLLVSLLVLAHWVGCINFMVRVIYAPLVSLLMC
jgi:hyperpolarization activated cyclic nucleotide-gated potassium channel 2